MATKALGLAGRSIHLKIYPTARSFAERREILRILERFGEVEMFRSLKYDQNPIPNAFLSILATEEAAKKAVEASPIRYSILHEPAEAHPSSSAPKSTLYELRISTSNYNHAATPPLSPIYGPYKPIETRLSPIAADLEARIPSSMMKKGLCDWVTGSVGGEERRRAEMDMAELTGVSVGKGSGGRGPSTVPWRLRRKEGKKNEAAA